ncbi:MASE3 domain-containing protein [Methanocalculus sp.]|uniref:MASE3 domain-containing protein n=1 Tax=Methanocalculus sp. TaxID=2004547 RepID=UPI0017A1854A|nr:MASE3 domain-containing protein [Methanocalculus sp.]HIJ07657.1 hypothetical protein [Methanocalculus sp.]
MGSSEDTHIRFFFLTLFIFLIATTLTSLINYLLFHTIAELFSIVIGCLIFMIAWTYDRVDGTGSDREQLPPLHWDRILLHCRN